MRTVCRHLALFVVVTYSISRATSSDIASVTFKRQSEKDGFKCNSTLSVFGVKNTSCMACAIECSQHESCVGMYCKRKAKQCIGCRAGLNIVSTDVWTGSSFYEKNGITSDPSHYGKYCMESTECSFSNSACIQSVCDCRPGYRREPRNKTCVLNCETYGSTYIAHLGMKHVVPDQVFTASVEECKSNCSSTATCRGFNYCLSCGSMCGPRVETNPLDIFADSAFDHYTRNCEYIQV